MKSVRAVLLVVVVLAAAAFAQSDAQKSFDQLKTLAGAWDGVIHCEVLEETRNKSLAYSWKGGHESNAQEYGSLLDTIVTWTLVKVDGGTRLRLNDRSCWVRTLAPARITALRSLDHARSGHPD